MNLNDEKTKNYIILALAGCVIILTIYILARDNRPQAYYPPAGKNGKGSKNQGISPYHDNQVKNTIVKNYKSLKNCYKAFTDKMPKVSDGRLLADFEIDDDGDVRKAAIVKSPFGDKIFHSCLISKINSWKFPEPNIPAPVYVSHTFIFKDTKNKPKTKDKPGFEVVKVPKK